ncbi:hypothetical protein FE407_07675 [Leuconostoc carnosum]|uniref:hypothetical protein n=1 Tax=Leuconostoc TaxID=1243 RepID=UPI00107538A4|nr:MULTISPECIES: hypothetical protein [Leuconostoc]KAA8324474.1 hypothetical protein FE404_07190 [Leuconostoc carnosum]KAA8358146.1 hypothetical protein FE407_07675 [Leuconostoc carnosum]KAA8364644.1 hypothetical protein FE406_07670 [Leuconostoc carnosum]KAA8365518.1 hypothetical protein FE416_07980 [Leuconostoc carnosum]KAA8371547.1 hypothetical protein FE415_08170 [Leuconostoc carnosum]
MTQQHYNLLLKRNRMLYWEQIRIKFIIVTLVYVMLLLQARYQQQFYGVFYGVLQAPNDFVMPIQWFFIMLMPVAVIGDSFNQLVKIEYPLLNRVGLGTYILSIFQIMSEMLFLFWLLWILIPGNNQYYLFSVILFLNSSLSIFIFSLISLFLSPVIAYFIAILLAMGTIANNKLPILSQFMLSRFDSNLMINLFNTIILILIMIILFSCIRYIEFTQIRK